MAAWDDGGVTWSFQADDALGTFWHFVVCGPEWQVEEGYVQVKDQWNDQRIDQRKDLSVERLGKLKVERSVRDHWHD